MKLVAGLMMVISVLGVIGRLLEPVSSMTDLLVRCWVRLWPCGSLRLSAILLRMLGLKLVLRSLCLIPRASMCWIVWLMSVLLR